MFSTALLALGFTTLVSAFVTNPQPLLSDFQRALEYSESVNCVDVVDYNRYPNASQATPFEALHPTTFYGRVFDNATGNAGMVVKNDYLKTIYVSFRESETLQLWAEDAQMWLVAPTVLTTPLYVDASSQVRVGTQIHNGFAIGYQVLRNKLLPIVKQAADANPTYKIVYTGHSLGGAIAHIAVADFALQLPQYQSRISLISVAAPRTGNTVWATFLNDLSFSSRIYRLVSISDPFPHAIPQALGYEHTFREYVLTPISVFSSTPSSNPTIVQCPAASDGSGECVSADLSWFEDPSIHPPTMYAYALGLTTAAFCARSKTGAIF